MKETKKEHDIQTTRKKMKTWIICCFALFLTYGSILVVEALYYGGDMRAAIISVLVSLPIMIIVFTIYIKFPGKIYIVIFTVLATQILFLVAGTYLKEMEYYFIVMLLVLGTCMVIKNFKLLAACTVFMIIIHIVAFMFFLQQLEWLNRYRFNVEFLFFILGAVFFMIITHSVEQKENSSERSHMAFTSLLRSTPNFMVITDAKNKVRHISAPMAEFAYFSSQELAVGKPLLDLFSDKRLKLMFADILNAGGFIETVMTIHMDNEDRHFKVVADRLTGDISGLFIDITDITQMMESMNNQRIAEEARARAESASQYKSKFLANMSHEIRTPLGAIIGIAQIELQKDNLTEENANAMEMIYLSGNSLLGIINDILDLSKIETGKLELSPMEYDVPSFINDTSQINAVRIGTKEIDFIVDADKNLPSKLYGDELRIKQILNNLLSNAIKYTEKGYVKLSINHRTDDETVYLRFTVKDTGMGMKKEDQEKLFIEYQRFDISANRETEGTGLGLTIAGKLIDMMDGTIEVESEYGKGSIFTVTIKQKAVECEEIGDLISDSLKNFAFSGEKHSSKLQKSRASLPHGRVLVVDDVEINILIAQEILLTYELTVETANSGFEALERVENGEVFDIIFMDHMMPGMDGIETTKKIRDTGYNGAILALTANALIGNREMFMQNGFDGFVPKPIDIGDMDAVLNEHIRAEHT
ncbi:MAG: response regulator [Oscillospiraceae bacterium]|nr:response regulator [Oscillospiraceae bacterium]